MNQLLAWLVGPSACAARRVCLEGHPGLLLPLAAADLVVAVCFLAVLFGLFWFLRRRPDLIEEHQALARLAGAFVITAAATGIIRVVTIWQPLGGLEVVVEVVMAALFLATLVAAWPLAPELIRLSSPRQLRDLNQRLRQEVAAHESTLRELEQTRRGLESRVAERTQELSLITARFRTALRGSKVHIFSQDRDMRYTAVSDPMFGSEVEAIVGRTDDDILSDGSRAAVVALKRKALDSGVAQDGEVSVDVEAALRWYDLHVEPLRDAGNHVVGLTGAAVDITGRKEGEAHLRLLMRELTHRSKNLLAVIQAMARQTGRHAGSIEAFLDQFSARVQALATSHDLLIQESWYGVSLPELVRSQLGHYLDRSGSQVSIEGEAVILKPEVAQSLGLAIHELATNAAKYGALSLPDGRISISWKRVPQTKGEGVEITWAEVGGPAVAPPDRRGFGSLVIERNLARSVEAEVDLAFAPEGARCRIVIPTTQLLGAR
jgi:PAS domain S-box-containing protein